MGDNLFPLLFLAIIAIAFWLLVIRPAKARAAAQQAVVNSVEPGVRILLASGIIGTVTERGESELRVEVAPGVVLTVVDQAVLRVLEPVEPAESTGTDSAAQASSPSADQT